MSKNLNAIFFTWFLIFCKMALLCKTWTAWDVVYSYLAFRFQQRVLRSFLLGIENIQKGKINLSSNNILSISMNLLATGLKVGKMEDWIWPPGTCYIISCHCAKFITSQNGIIYWNILLNKGKIWSLNMMLCFSNIRCLI